MKNSIDFYCKNCKKSLKISYEASGNPEQPVMAGITMRCHTNKCVRVMVMKNYNEQEILSKADKLGRVYI